MKSRAHVVAGTGNNAGTAVAKAANSSNRIVGWTLKNTSAADAWVSPVSPATNADYYLEAGGILTGQHAGAIYGCPDGATFTTWEEYT